MNFRHRMQAEKKKAEFICIYEKRGGGKWLAGKKQKIIK